MKRKLKSFPEKKTVIANTRSTSTTRNWKLIKVSQEALFKVFTNPTDLAAWLAPGEMTGKVHSFDLKVGGGYQMSLYYPESEKEFRGKTTEKEDRFTARFVELTPPHRIVQAVTFESDDPAFKGEMIMEVSFKAKNSGTIVIFVFRNIPPGIRPEDNKAGTRATLEKLSQYVESSMWLQKGN